MLPALLGRLVGLGAHVTPVPAVSAGPLGLPPVPFQVSTRFAINFSTMGLVSSWLVPVPILHTGCRVIPCWQRFPDAVQQLSVLLCCKLLISEAIRSVAVYLSLSHASRVMDTCMANPGSHLELCFFSFALNSTWQVSMLSSLSMIGAGPA